MTGATIWFTGLSGSGKSTIAALIKEKLRAQNRNIVIVDGDEVRKTVNKDLDYSAEGRRKNITRIADMCKLLTEQDVLNLACVISPSREIRRYARNNIPNFIEVYIKCPLVTCETRDPKGHYKRVRATKEDFVGITIPYEEPINPEIVIETDTMSPEQSAATIIQYLKKYMNSKRSKKS